MGFRDSITIITAVLMCGWAGCSRPCHSNSGSAQPEPATFYQPFTQEASIPESLVERPPYRLNVGDKLEISYQVRNEPTDRPYQIKIEDGIRIVFPYQDRFNQEARVGGDGQIRCLLIGQVRAAGRSAAELEEQLKVAYGRYLKEPELTVITTAANGKIEELKKSVTTATPGGQSRLVPVKPDGTIDLPYIGEVYVVGKTVTESKKLIDQKYEEENLPEVDVSVQTSEFAAKRIYVHGEVATAGVIEASSPLTLIQALIERGGVTARGDRSKILLVRRKHLPIPEAIVFDMNAALEISKIAAARDPASAGESYRRDIYLADGDMVYVPPTGLAQANDWIDQVFTRGVRAVIPYSGYVGMDFGYEVRNAPTPVKLSR